MQVVICGLCHHIRQHTHPGVRENRLKNINRQTNISGESSIYLNDNNYLALTQHIWGITWVRADEGELGVKILNLLLTGCVSLVRSVRFSDPWLPTAMLRCWG